jgi:hypothetical protein
MECRRIWLISPVAHQPSLERMGIDTKRTVNVGGFTEGQRRFLDFHRNAVLFRAARGLRACRALFGPIQVESHPHGDSLFARDGAGLPQDATKNGKHGAVASHLAELIDALRARIEIRRMARNPVMLTALAVVRWNERRLPEQRADLYESIVTWLVRSREQRHGRETADCCLALLGHLALGMQTYWQGRLLTQISKGRAAEIIARQFRGVDRERRLCCWPRAS